MKIAISGASGFVGTHLSAYLQSQGYDIVPLARRDFADGSEERLARIVAECDAVVNLAGATIDRRWSRAYKKELYASRVDTTRRLVDAVDRSPRTTTFISTSAVGYYPAVGCYDETGERGSGFLAELCEAWEQEARRVKVRCVITRFGVVFADGGGAFARMSRPAEFGIAVVAGGGLQPFSWIAAEDLVRAEEFLLLHSELDGVFNLAAPQKLTQKEVARAITAHYRKGMTVHIPAFVLQIALGEAADFLLHGQCAVPSRLLEAGFGFRIPTLGKFLSGL